MSETILKILPTIILALVALAGALGLWALLRGKLGELFDYLAVKTKVDFLRHVDDILIGAAGQAYDDGIDWAKTALADGKVTPAEWRDLKERALSLGMGLLDLEQLCGYVGDADAYLETRVGHALAVSKARGAGAKKPAPVGPAPDPSAP